jgi:hypothetical protein
MIEYRRMNRSGPVPKIGSINAVTAKKSSWEASYTR